MRSILSTGASIFGSFLVMLVAAYFLIPYINPEKKQVMDNNTGQFYQEDSISTRYDIATVDSLQSKTDSLNQLVQSYSDKEAEYLATIDSLEQHIEQIEEEKTTLQSEIPETVAIEDVEEVSKSLLNLDEEQLTSIVNILKEDQLISLYKSASNMQRSKLLRSLEPEKAAGILKQIM